MNQINILDLIYSDTFREISKFLNIRDIFNLRCISVDLRDYLDNEFAVLRIVNLAGENERTVDAFRVLSEKCCNLRVLNVSSCQWLALNEDLLITMLVRNSHSLRQVNLSRCGNLTMALQPLIINCKNLQKLNLSYCSWLTVGSLEALIFHHSYIEELDLNGCCALSERCLTLLLQKFRRLKILCLANVPTVDDNTLFTISKFQTDIVHLNLFKCAAITDRGIGALSLNCQKLETLSVRGCNRISDRSLDLLRKRNIHIDVPKNATNAFINRFNEFERPREFYLQV